MNARARPVGDRAVLLELPDNAAVHVAARRARERYGEQLAEVVPGHATLLLVGRRGRPRVDLDGLEAEATAEATGAPVLLTVHYDGADLQTVAGQLGVSTNAVVSLHTGAVYTVAFMGFAPGFPYLVCERDSPLLGLPRRAGPRPAVPAGSVAVAAGYCGIYPRRLPGGWNLIGRTDAVLFDPAREPPALLAPGARVRFQAGEL